MRVRSAAAPGVVTVTASAKSLGGRKLRVAVRARELVPACHAVTATCARRGGGVASPAPHRALPPSARPGSPPCAQVVGGGPSGACAAETLAKAGIETYLIERKMDNCKPCGGAIPLCMIDEFDLPMEIVDRKARETYIRDSGLARARAHAWRRDERSSCSN